MSPQSQSPKSPAAIPVRPRSPTQKSCAPVLAPAMPPAANPTSPPPHASSTASEIKIADSAKLSRTQRLHQSHFRPPLKHRRRHRRRNRQPRGKQRRQRDQQHQPLDPRQHVALILRYLPNLLRMRMRNRLGQLKRNRLRIRRAIPPVAVRRTQRIRISPRKRIFWLGHRADKNLPHRPRLSRQRLRQTQRRNNLIILRARRSKECPSRDAGLPLISICCPGANSRPCRQLLANQNFVGIIRWPASAHLPPGKSRSRSGSELPRPILQRLRKVGSHQRDFVSLPPAIPARTFTGSSGANATILFPQKIPLIFGSAASSR